MPLLEFGLQQLLPEKGRIEQMVTGIIFAVTELGFADHKIHLKLREILETSCNYSKDKEVWLSTPFHCANCLHTLFDGYPKPEMGKKYRLEDYEKFLKVEV